MDLHLAPNSTQFFSMCRAKTLAQNRSVFGNAEVNVDVRYSLLAACQVKSKPNQQNCKMRYERSTDSLFYGQPTHTTPRSVNRPRAVIELL
tara:strand:- start:2594 stop:2866 length:273 start_codon:yes stop_codon:yes gene_type:complete